jgi:hypothetical protein
MFGEDLVGWCSARRSRNSYVSGSTEGGERCAVLTHTALGEGLLDLEGLPESEAVSGLLGEDDFSFFAFGSLG